MVMTGDRQTVISGEISDFLRNQWISYYVSAKFCTNHKISYEIVISTEITNLDSISREIL